MLDSGVLPSTGLGMPSLPNGLNPLVCTHHSLAVIEAVLIQSRSRVHHHICSLELVLIQALVDCPALVPRLRIFKNAPNFRTVPLHLAVGYQI